MHLYIYPKSVPSLLLAYDQGHWGAFSINRRRQPFFFRDVQDILPHCALKTAQPSPLNQCTHPVPPKSPLDKNQAEVPVGSRAEITHQKCSLATNFSDLDEANGRYGVKFVAGEQRTQLLVNKNR